MEKPRLGLHRPQDHQAYEEHRGRAAWAQGTHFPSSTQRSGFPEGMRGRSVYRHRRGIVSVNKVSCLTTQWSFNLLPAQPTANSESAGEVRVQEAMAL